MHSRESGHVVAVVAAIEWLSHRVLSSPQVNPYLLIWKREKGSSSSPDNQGTVLEPHDLLTPTRRHTTSTPHILKDSLMI